MRTALVLLAAGAAAAAQRPSGFNGHRKGRIFKASTLQADPVLLGSVEGAAVRALR